MKKYKYLRKTILLIFVLCVVTSFFSLTNYNLLNLGLTASYASFLVLFVGVIVFPISYHLENKKENEKNNDWLEYLIQEKKVQEEIENERKIIEEKENEEKEKQQKIQEERKREELFDKITYVKNNLTKIEELAKKYETPFFNYLDKFGDTVLDFFVLFSFIFDQVYQEDSVRGKVLHYFFEKDEIQYIENAKNYTYIQRNTKLTETFISGIKQRLLQANEWDDEETFETALYLILRTNAIKHQHDEYQSTIGYETLEELYLNEKYNDLPSDFSFYYIYETDINLPIVETTLALQKEYKNVIEQIQTKEMEKDLFESNTYVSDINQNSETDPLQTELSTKKTIHTIDLMSGREFEEFIAEYFEKKGYKVTLTPSSGDYGIDVIIENDFVKIGIQTKCYNDKVPNAAVQEAVTGIKHYRLDKAMVITNNYFQPSAIQLAEDNNVILWNRDKLESELLK